MANAVDHPHWNWTFGAPKGEEDRVGELRVFITTDPTYTSITSVNTCWELTDAEIEEIVRTRRVMMNCLGGGLMAHFIGSESVVREFAMDFGKTWPKEER